MPRHPALLAAAVVVAGCATAGAGAPVPSAFTPAELVPGCRVRFRVTMPITFHDPTGRSAS